MKLLVLGGTGTVGSQVVRELVRRGQADVRVLTRDANKATSLPPGAHGAVAATAAEIERQTDLLGHPPRNLESFARETARTWGL